MTGIPMQINVLFLMIALFSSGVASLKDDFLYLVEKYHQGTVYKDFHNEDPFKEGLPFAIDEIDPPFLQDQYLKWMKQLVRGIVEEDKPELDIPHHPKILRQYAYTYVPGKAINTLRSAMEEVQKNNIPGDFVEVGVWRGGIPMFMKAFLKAHGDHTRKVWVVDSFAGWPPATNDPDALVCNNESVPWIVVPLEEVQDNFRRHGLLDDQVVFLKGWVKDTMPTAPIEQIAVLRIDVDLYEPTRDVLEALYPKLAVGGYVIIDDYFCFPGCDRAVDEYRKKHNISAPLFRQDSQAPGICWKKE